MTERELRAEAKRTIRVARQIFSERVEREIQAAAARPPSPSSSRHARELKSKVREQTRLGWWVVREGPILKRLLEGGLMNKADAAKIKPYRLWSLWRGDDRVTLTAKVPPSLRDLLRKLAKRDGGTMAEMIAKMLTQAAESW